MNKSQLITKLDDIYEQIIKLEDEFFHLAVEENLFGIDHSQDIENTIKEIDLLGDEYLLSVGEIKPWIYPNKKSRNNINYRIASRALNLKGKLHNLTENDIYDFNYMLITGTKGRFSRKEVTNSLYNLYDIAGNAPECLLMGNAWEAGLLSHISCDNAISFYESVKEREEGNYNLARLLYKGVSKQNYYRAFDLVTSKMQLLSCDSLNLLARMYLDGKSVPCDERMAYKCMELSASMMYFRGLTNLGLMTFFGIGCKADREKGLKLLSLADFAGSDEASILHEKLISGTLTIFSANLLEQIPYNFGTHLRALKERAKVNDMKALIQLGYIYKAPEVFLTTCYEEAIKWYHKAAMEGSLYAAIIFQNIKYQCEFEIVDSINSKPEAYRGVSDFIKEKVFSTTLLSDFGDNGLEDEIPRDKYCPIEALYWLLMIKGTNEKYNDSWFEWLEWQKKQFQKLRRYNYKYKLSLYNKKNQTIN